jgi:4-diphosphocytidyl-2-C-methyl-D-erythritol kinase
MVKELAYAKINLNLGIVGKLENNYHDLRSVMMSIDLHDELTFEISDEDQLISNIEIPNNIILKTLHLFRNTYNIDQKVKITLKKNIPLGSGLGGGSSDSAATLRALNVLFNVNVDLGDLSELSSTLGSDITFCLYNKPSIAFVKGDNLIFTHYPDRLDYTLLFSPIECSTKEVFSNYILDSTKKHYHQVEKLMTSYMNYDFKYYFEHTFNDLTISILHSYPSLVPLYQKLKKSKYSFFFTGSGSTIVIIGHVEPLELNLNYKHVSILK